jgi:hypothetical protein
VRQAPGTPISTYSPVFSIAHVPFRVLLDPSPVNPDAPDLLGMGAVAPPTVSDRLSG